MSLLVTLAKLTSASCVKELQWSYVCIKLLLATITVVQVLPYVPFLRLFLLHSISLRLNTIKK